MRKLITFVAAWACVGSLAACSPDAPAVDPAQPAGSSEPGTLRVLAGSELADMQPVLDEAAKATGVKVKFTFSGTLEGADTLANGGADGTYDAVWFSSNRYPQGIPEAAKRLGNQVKIMSSPVVLGLSAPMAQRLGWDVKPVGWGEIAAEAGKRSFSYGMTDPSASNSGFSALVGVAAALAGTGSAINAEQIVSVTPALTQFFSAQAMSAGSSGWLSDAYQRRAIGADPGQKVDGLINYESVLLSMNAGGKLPQPLKLVYPSDGVVTADYPLTLLNSANEAARSAHQRLADYLRTPDVQRKIMETTQRRPVTPGVALSAQFAQRDLIELPFPATQQAVDALLAAYFDKIRRPSRTLYVLDTSGSMAGERMESLRTALAGLTGADGSLTGRYRRFRSREEITMLPFSSAPANPQTFTVPGNDPQPELDKVKAFADGLSAYGGTAIDDSLTRAFQVMDDLVAKDPDRFNSIVLMTDGENTNGSDRGTFENGFPALPESARQIPVFTVLFGEGSSDDDRVRLVSADPSAEAGQLRSGLDTLLRKVDERRGRMPDTAADRVRRIGEVLGDMLERRGGLTANPDVLHSLTRLAAVDLPLSVQTYLNLPWWFAAKRRTGGEASAAEQLIAQLELLETESHRIAEQFYASDINQQADHTRYLRERDLEGG